MTVMRLLPQTQYIHTSASLTVTDKFKSEIDVSDAANWPCPVPDSQRLFLVHQGPCRMDNIKFPVNDRGRHFIANMYTSILSNGEKVDRRWLVYSMSSDRVFCFCCKLFVLSSNKFAAMGFDDWNHSLVLIHEHETSQKHVETYLKRLEMEHRLNTGIGPLIDNMLQKQLNAEKLHWRNVLQRLLAIVQFLSQRNLTFRGTSDKLDDQNNGNFLGIIQLLAQFDPVLCEYIRRIGSSEINDHYLGKNMQNEFIQLLSNAVVDKVTDIVNSAKYYAVILDCTPDVSHLEQLTVILRCVRIVGTSVDVTEHFVGFVVAEKSTELGLSEMLLRKLKALKLCVFNCRGQGYDNGANMRGQNKGVQARILSQERRVLFMPCGCHSLNLVVSDMAKSSAVAISLFGTIQRIYVLFASSTQRWSVFTNRLKIYTLKPLCETRWESRVSSIKAIRYQIGEVYDALIDLSLDNKDAKCVTEAATLAKEIKNFKFLVTLVIWYNILTQINLSSKLLQKQNMNLHEAVSTLQKTNEFLRSYKESGLPGSIATAKVLADELEMTPEEMTFPREADVRRRRKKTQFSYEAPDEPVENPEDDYRINFFNVLMDQAIMSFEERFSQLMKFQDIFGFLFNIQAYKEIHSDCSASAELLKLCLSLQQAMSEKGDGTVDDESDIDGQSLYDEVKTLANILPQNSVSPLDVLRYMVSNGLQELLPNLTVALCILLTVPVTVASGERSFSRLKLIKTYLRSTMSQDRLVGLAILSIENDVAQTLDFADLLSEFASQKARKISM
jgi:hypothetical protein